MLIRTQGVILKSRNIGEQDRIITVLSPEFGLMELSARRARQMKSSIAGATQVFCFSEFCIFRGKKYDVINSAHSIETFYALRFDVEKLALACYFCELVSVVAPLPQTAQVSLRLLLNTLFFLTEDKYDPRLLKAIFELKLLSLVGFLPTLTGCHGCLCYTASMMYFDLHNGLLFCQTCNKKISSPNILLGEATLQAMRHIVYADDQKMFSFQLRGESLNQLAYLCEQYVCLHTEQRFSSLQCYHQVRVGCTEGENSLSSYPSKGAVDV